MNVWAFLVIFLACAAFAAACSFWVLSDAIARPGWKRVVVSSGLLVVFALMQLTLIHWGINHGGHL